MRTGHPWLMFTSVRIQQMNTRFLFWSIGSSLTIGFCAGVALTAPSHSFVFEATNTPFGSYVFRNLPQDSLLLPAPHQNEQDFCFNLVA